MREFLRKVLDMPTVRAMIVVVPSVLLTMYFITLVRADAIGQEPHTETHIDRSLAVDVFSIKEEDGELLESPKFLALREALKSVRQTGRIHRWTLVRDPEDEGIVYLELEGPVVGDGAGLKLILRF